MTIIVHLCVACTDGIFLIPSGFDSELRVTLQQIGSGYEGAFERQDDVSSVAYWYQIEPHSIFPELPEPSKRHPR